MLYVVTASHNRKKITTEFAKRLKESGCQDYKLLLVDDGSTDGTAEAVQTILEKRAIILRGKGNLWWGGALHKAYKWLCENADSDDVVLFSNDDVIYAPDYLSKGIDLLSGQKKKLLLGLAYSDKTGQLFDAPVEWDCSIAEGKKRTCPPWRGNCASTRSLFFRVEDMKQIGGFHPILLPHYLSDYEWTIRACKKGYEVISSEKLYYEIILYYA